MERINSIQEDKRLRYIVDFLNQKWYNISYKSLETFINRLRSKGYKLEFDDINSFFDELEKILYTRNPVSKLLGRILNQSYIFKFSWLLEKWKEKVFEIFGKNVEENKFLFNTLKNAKYYNYEGEVYTLGVDIKWNTKEIFSKDILKRFFSLTNLFEELFENFAVFSYVEWDKLYVWYFDDSNPKEIIEIFNLYTTFLKVLTKKDYHIELFKWKKEKWESIIVAFKEAFIQTIYSHTLDKEFKEVKKYFWGNNLVSREIIQILGIDLSHLPNLPWNQYFDISLDDKVNLEKLRDIIERLKKIWFKNEQIIQSALLHYLLKVDGWSPKVEYIKKWNKLISYGESDTDVYLILDWKVQLFLGWNRFLSKIIEAKTIVWEMSVWWKPANADVYAYEDLKVIRIPKKIFEDFKNHLNSVLLNAFNWLMERYRTARDIENISLNKTYLDLKQKLGEEKMKLLFGKLYWLKKGDQIVADKDNNVVLTVEGRTNNYVYIISPGSKIVIQRWWKTKQFELSSSTIIWERSFLKNKLFNQESIANATIKLVSWKAYKIDFDNFDKELDNISEQLNISREDIDAALMIISDHREKTDKVFVNLSFDNGQEYRLAA